MRWSMWPVSICVHIVVVVAALIVPLMADEDWPLPAPLHRLVVTTKVVPVPEPVVEAVRTTRTAPVLPSVSAPPTLEPPRDDAATPPGPVVPGVPSTNAPIDPALLGSSVGTGPVPPVSPPREANLVQPTLLRVGQGVREPKRIAGAMPEYPDIARRARIQGMVVLEAVINERGRVERIRVLRSVPLLDAAAIGAFQEWRYTPTLLNGVPVSVLMTITINFTLQN